MVQITNLVEVKILRLEKTHSRENYQCEDDSLTEYLKKQINQDIRIRLTTCYITIEKQQIVTGYYTLSSESLGRATIPHKFIKRVPKITMFQLFYWADWREIFQPKELNWTF